MTEFSLKAYHAHEKISKGNMDPIKEIEIIRFDNKVVAPIPEGELYCFHNFYTILQDETSVSLNITNQAKQGISELLKHTFAAKYLPQIIYLLFEKIKNNQSVPQSIQLILYTFEIIFYQRALPMMSISKMIKKLSNDYNIIELIIDSCIFYSRAVYSKIESKENLGDIGNNTYIGKYPHAINFEVRFKFLEFAIKRNSDCLELGNDNLQKLWDLYVTFGKSEYDTKAFFKWISIETEPGVNNYSGQIFKKEERDLLFKLICSSRDKLEKNMGILYYKCFVSQFTKLNIITGSLWNTLGGVLVKNYNLIGMDAIWENVSFNQNENGRLKFAELLVELYLNMSESLEKSKTTIWGEFIDKCMNSIISAERENHENIIENYVKLLLLFVETLDGKKYIVHNDSAHRFVLCVVSRENMNEEIGKIKVGFEITIGQIRKKIADLLRLPFRGFQMAAKGKVYGYENDDECLKDIGWSKTIIIQKSESDPKQNPKYLLSQNKEYINHIFLLLSKKESTFADVVWELLNSLPPNQNAIEAIEKIALENETPVWKDLLDSSSVHKFFYSLQIVDDIISQFKEKQLAENATNQGKWLINFCSKGGHAHLYYALLNLPITSLNHPLTQKCFSLLIKILFYLQTIDSNLEKSIPNYKELRPNIIQRILMILETISQCSISTVVEKEVKARRSEKITEDGKEENAENKEEIENQALAQKKKKQIEEGFIFDLGFKLIQGPHPADFNFFEEITKFEKLRDLLLKGLILSDNSSLQGCFAKQLCNVINLYKNVPLYDKHPYTFILKMMLEDLIKETLVYEKKVHEFYWLLSFIIEEIPQQIFKKFPMNFHNILGEVCENIKKHEVKENYSTDTDYVIIGQLDLLKVLLRKFPKEKEFVGQTCGLISELLNGCLFEFPHESSGKKTLKLLPPKCKSQPARKAAYDLLCTLARDTPPNLTQIIDYLSPIHS